MMLFIYGLLPAVLFYGLLLFGIIGSIISVFLPSIPFVGKYEALFKLVSVLALCSGLVFLGINESETAYKAKEAVLSQRVKDLEGRAPIINTVVKTEYVDRVQVIKEKGDTIVKQVPVYITKASDLKCPVPAGLVRLLNDAASNSGLPEASPGADGSTGKSTEAAGATGKPQ